MTKDNITKCLEFTRGKMYYAGKDDRGKLVYEIATLEGGNLVQEDDFIIRGVSGEFYPCKPHIFYQTYELRSEDSMKVLAKVKTWEELVETCNGVDDDGTLLFDGDDFTEDMKEYCGETFEVSLDEDGGFEYDCWNFTPEMFTIIDKKEEQEENAPRKTCINCDREVEYIKPIDEDDVDFPVICDECIIDMI